MEEFETLNDRIGYLAENFRESHQLSFDENGVEYLQKYLMGT
jgi:hypothetical protein